jgi:hypothetical protein
MQASQAVAASAARTANGSSGVLNAGPSKGGHFVIDVTAVSGTTPTLVATIQGVDHVSGKAYTLLASASINAIGTTVLKIHPGLVAAANLVANDILPPQFQVTWTIGGTTPSFTFTIGYQPVHD